MQDPSLKIEIEMLESQVQALEFAILRERTANAALHQRNIILRDRVAELEKELVSLRPNPLTPDKEPA